MLSTYLINNYVKTMIDPKSSSIFVGFGVMAESFVSIDGYSDSVPCVNTIGASTGDRVRLEIKDGTVFITGIVSKADIPSGTSEEA